MRSPEEIVIGILSRRSVTDPVSVGEYLSDKPALTHDPFLMPDIYQAMEKIMSVYVHGGNICVYGDYDVDGIMGVVLFTLFLRKLPDSGKGRVSCYIPSRFDEGYGLNVSALSRIKDAGVDLVITVDCGSVSRKEVAYAADIGLDIIVSDHHECAEGLSPDCPFVDPKRRDSAYPFSELSGTGVVFKIAQAIGKHYYPDDIELRRYLNSLADLVAIATVADVVPLKDENRTFVKYGLSIMRTSPRMPLRKLCEAIDIEPAQLNAYYIAFGVAPHLNAAGRMGDAAIATELFLADDIGRMEEIAAELSKKNKERRRIQDEAIDECVKIAESDYKDDLFLILKPDKLHEGVSGIVAGKIKERFGLPTAVLTATLSDADGEEGTLKGSARSIEGVDLISMLRAHEDLFSKLGGHAMAAGFSMPASNEPLLRSVLNEAMNEIAAGQPGLFDRHERFDDVIDCSEATLELAELFERFEPTGSGNPKPAVRIDGLAPYALRRVGEGGRHLSFMVKPAELFDGKNGSVDGAGMRGLKCIMFGRDGKRADLPDAAKVSLIGTLEVNRWNGSESVQLKVREAL